MLILKYGCGVSPFVRAVVSWSGGKDSALALYAVLRGGFEVVGLVTTVDLRSWVVTGHRVPVRLVELQARAVGLPLYTVGLPGDLPEVSVYEEAVLDVLSRLKSELNVGYVVYGDIHLRDVMEYKRRLLERIDLKAVYPLEGLDPITLTDIALNLEFKAIIVALDPARVAADLVCRELDRRALKKLPAAVDPAGEYGEYHTFVYKAPIYREDLRLEVRGVSLFEDPHTGSRKLVCNIESL